MAKTTTILAAKRTKVNFQPSGETSDSRSGTTPLYAPLQNRQNHGRDGSANKRRYELRQRKHAGYDRRLLLRQSQQNRYGKLDWLVRVNGVLMLAAIFLAVFSTVKIKLSRN